MTKFVFVLMVLCIVVAGCDDKEEKVQEAGITKNKSEDQILKELTSDINKKFNEEDLNNIERYLRNKNWDIDSTQTGIFYYIFETNDSIKPQEGDRVVVEYDISTLDGKNLYSSEENGATIFSVNKEDMESGVHEAVQMLGVGDKGVFIMVNTRAHGVLGDEDKVMPYQVLVYKLKLVGIES